MLILQIHLLFNLTNYYKYEVSKFDLINLTRKRVGDSYVNWEIYKAK